MSNCKQRTFLFACFCTTCDVPELMCWMLILFSTQTADHCDQWQGILMKSIQIVSVFETIFFKIFINDLLVALIVVISMVQSIIQCLRAFFFSACILDFSMNIFLYKYFGCDAFILIFWKRNVVWIHQIHFRSNTLTDYCPFLSFECSIFVI